MGFYKEHREQIEDLVALVKEETKKEVILLKAEEDKEGSIISSKMKGSFYLPQKGSLPINGRGDALALFAQLNLEEVPKNSIYPKKGIIQFFIDPKDDLYGVDFSNQLSDEKKRVIYYPNIEDHYKREELEKIYPHSFSEPFGPLQGNISFALSFEKKEESIFLDDYRFDPYFANKWNSLFPEYKIEEAYDLNSLDRDLFSMIEDEFTILDDLSKIGGYSYFTQEDPRKMEQYSAYSELLFQLDSYGFDEPFDVMWGDAGIGAFFATKEQLELMNFAQCLYHWDCG